MYASIQFCRNKFFITSLSYLADTFTDLQFELAIFDLFLGYFCVILTRSKKSFLGISSSGS